ncbi:MAG TPA: hypothetical protein VFY63_15745 [Pseudorhizobium sp.]|nr:hypothetical protein [Pseudorhizobium sp.]
MSEITNDMRKALTFIRDYRITSSEWRKNGKPASGHPDTWNQFRMSGPEASLTISAETQKATRPFVVVGPVDGSMYVLNDKGKAALKEASDAST